MKNKILSLALCFGLWPALGSASPQDREKEVLKAIDDLCGDTWCEGSFDYRFDRLGISGEKQRAQLFFEMKTDVPVSFTVASEKLVHAQILQQSYAVSCTIEGVSKASEMLNGTHSLRWEIYVSLNDCISTLEGKFSHIVRP